MLNIFCAELWSDLLRNKDIMGNQKRRLKVRVSYDVNRLSHDNLMNVYKNVVPIQKKEIPCFNNKNLVENKKMPPTKKIKLELNLSKKEHINTKRKKYS